MLCVLSSSTNKIWEFQAKFPENKDCMLNDHLSKVTGYLLTANHIRFLWHVQDRILEFYWFKDLLLTMLLYFVYF